jgi:autotransporter-associated beta strand protein
VLQFCEGSGRIPPERTADLGRVVRLPVIQKDRQFNVPATHLVPPQSPPTRGARIEKRLPGIAKIPKNVKFSPETIDGGGSAIQANIRNIGKKSLARSSTAMKPHQTHLFLALTLISTTSATELYWDVNGDTGVATGGAGTWTNPNTWRGESATGTLGSWVDDSTAIFGGTAGLVQMPSEVKVNQIKPITHNYNIGAVAAGPIRFTGTYSETSPTIDSIGILPVAALRNTQVQAKITGTLTGGLIIRDPNDVTAIATAGRTYLNAGSNSDFIGDITVLSGNLHIFSNLGDPANNIILKGGALYGFSGTGITNYNVSRNIHVASDSVIGSRSDSGGTQNWNLTGNLTGSANLTRFHHNSTANVRFQGDLTAYTGTFDNRGGNLFIDTNLTSGGIWKLTGGTMIFDADRDTHIAHGPGKAALEINGGTLNLNGTSETINSLIGTSGSVLNNLPESTSTLTLGAADSSGSFAGTLANGSGILALTKIGSGAQQLGSTTHSGSTLIEAGTLTVNGAIASSPVTVKSAARFNLNSADPKLESLSLEGGSAFQSTLDANEIFITQINGDLVLSGGTVTLFPIISGAPTLGTYDFINAINIVGSASFAVDFSANGISRLAGTAAVSGTAVRITITQAGADLVWNNAEANGLWNLNGAKNFLNGSATDEYFNADSVRFGPSSPAGAITLQGSLMPSSVIVDSSGNFSFTGSGSISGATGLRKAGTGTLTIENDNTFTGNTKVEAGTLIVNGSIISDSPTNGFVDIDPLATLRGTGTLAGPVLIDELDGDRATIAPGTTAGTIGTLSTGPLTLWGAYDFDIHGATADRTAITGNLTLADTKLNVNFIAPSTAVNHPLITFTGSRTGVFDAESIPAGWEIDYTEPGKVVLWPTPTPPPAGTITFETTQGYPAAGTDLSAAGSNISNQPYDGEQGWSRSTSASGSRVHATASSGEYRASQAIGSATAGTYIGGKKGTVQITGSNTLTFDSPLIGGTAVGFMKDHDNDGLFDQGLSGTPVTPGDTGMGFGIGGTPARFQYRNALFGTEFNNTDVTPTANHWHRFHITIGPSTTGSRTITMAVRNLTTGTDIDFDPATEGTQPWTFTVSDAQFGPAPEAAEGIWVRTTGAARVDNLRASAIEPATGSAYDSWMNGFPELTGDARLPGSDPDNDGTSNLMEFVLNGDPRVSDTNVLPKPAHTPTGDLTLTFNRRDDSEPFANLTLQVGSTLATWDNFTIGATAGSSGNVSWTIDENGDAPDLITVTLSHTGPKTFTRLKVNPVTTP